MQKFKVTCLIPDFRREVYENCFFRSISNLWT